METGVGSNIYLQLGEQESSVKGQITGEHSTKRPAPSCLFLTSKPQPP